MSNLPFHTWNPNQKYGGLWCSNVPSITGWTEGMRYHVLGEWSLEDKVVASLFGPKTGLKGTTIRQPGHSYVIIAESASTQNSKNGTSMILHVASDWDKHRQGTCENKKKYKKHWNFRYSNNNWYKQHKQYKSTAITNALYLVSWFPTPQKIWFQVTNVRPLLWRKIFSPW